MAGMRKAQGSKAVKAVKAAKWDGCTTYAVENCGNRAVGIENGRLAPQLSDLADEHDVAADVRVQVLRGDARGRGRLSHDEGC